MERSTDQLKKRQQHSILPEFYRLSNPEGLAGIERLKIEEPRLVIHDQIVGQVEELIKGRNPRTTFTKATLNKAALEHLGGGPFENYGVWVYYPWSCSLVHCLDEDEFIEVRTNRNKNKITLEEEKILAQFKVGVIGLSVGQSIAVTMAMERSFGEIRLADFDVLELSNLNRIRVGIDQLGLKKVYAVAREIAEIDPFLKVKCFPDGLTRENMDEFFSHDGGIDLVVDECDGLDIKILARHKAKELKIPLVQDMSDRGTIDIERFDLEPERPIMHGLIDHLDLDLDVIADLSNEDKVPYLLPMIGEETISHRLRASMLEVGQTLTTWPQLASAVAAGGGMASDVCRRIALDQLHASGRFHVDLEDLIADQVTKDETVQDEEPVFNIEENLLQGPELDALMQEMRSAPAYSLQLALDQNTLEELLSAAVQAPSGGNNQPWRWVYKDKFLFLYHDEQLSKTYLDFQKNASYLAFGACVENLTLKAAEMGLEMSSIFEPCANKNLVSLFGFFKKGIAPPSKVQPVTGSYRSENIFTRETNRNIGEYSSIPTEELNALKGAVEEVPGYELELITDRAQLAELASIVAKIDRILITGQQKSHDDFFREIRWNSEEAEKTKDGVDINTLDITASENAGLHIARSWKVVKYLNKWKGGTAFEKLTKKCIEPASAMGLITSAEYSHKNYFEGGRAVQKVWLEADRHNISLQPHFSPICMFSRIIFGDNDGLTDEMLNELLPLREAYKSVFTTAKDNKSEIFLFRIGKAERPNVRSFRYPVEKVLNL